MGVGDELGEDLDAAAVEYGDGIAQCEQHVGSGSAGGPRFVDEGVGEDRAVCFAVGDVCMDEGGDEGGLPARV